MPLLEAASLLLPNGCLLSWAPNGAGGRTYVSDEIGGGVTVWETHRCEEGTLLAALNLEIALNSRPVVNGSFLGEEPNEVPLPNGGRLSWKLNEAGGRSYFSSEGGGVLVWDTCLALDSTLWAAMQVEAIFARQASRVRNSGEADV